MSKRHATESLEDVVAADSPAPKRARVEDAEDPDLPPPPATAGQVTNGHTNGTAHTDGIAEAAAQENEALAEPAGPADEDDEEDRPAISAPTRQTAPAEGYNDLYLDTINRKLLDFDFEKLCSVTLSNINVYACLVCGTYYQGRGPKSQAYYHALEIGHHVYINMETKKVYVLPEGYEVKNKSLDDIKYVVDPEFTKEDVAKLDKVRKEAWDLQGKKYNPGFVGLNNIKANDYFNVVAHSLAHVPPLRNFLLLENLSSRPQLVQRLAILVRKLWSPRAFKAHVSPHELLQEVSARSNKRFTSTEQSDPADFLAWFLNNLHLSLGGSRTKPQSSIIQKIFQGSMRVESQSITARADANDRLRFESSTEIKTNTTPFTILTLDLPPAPLQILGKYDGLRTQERLNTRLRYRLLHPLPPYLIMHIKRFSPNKFLQEQRNPTIVTFNPRSLDVSPYVEPNPSLHPMGEPVIYDLVANITHEGVRVRDDSVEGEAEKKVWRVQVVEKARGIEGGKDEGERWWEMQDLFVRQVEAELLSTKEAYVMVWERRRTKGKGKA
ncbi:Ubiquitin carboxyl-terminal hydrolase 10 [Taxawa tesnikishii (nom. ined.)]|nr:Ubiquitin carboxyl-terminal hydrolase 10 [Dothideales sp. JES 119]